MTLRPDGAYSVPSTTTDIVISNCAQVQVLGDTARSLLRLRSVELSGVGRVVLNEHALAWAPFRRDSELHPGLRILIRNSTVADIASHAVQGRVDDIVISDSTILNMRPFAFSSLTGVRNIELRNNVFQNVEIQAFKQFSTVNFFLRGGVVATLPSRFLSDVEVTELFQMESVNVSHISSLAFFVRSPKRVLIENNIIDTIEPDGFHMITHGPITFRNNTVKTMRKNALLGLSVAPDIVAVKGRLELLVDNNTVTALTPRSLAHNASALRARVDGLNLNISCACDLAHTWNDFLKDQGVINCWYDLEGHFVSLPTFFDSRCGKFKQTFWIFVVVGVVLVVIIASLVTFFIVRRENEKKKKVQIVYPDGKTYRETEFHIVVERAELLTTDL